MDSTGDKGKAVFSPEDGGAAAYVCPLPAVTGLLLLTPFFVSFDLVFSPTGNVVSSVASVSTHHGLYLVPSGNSGASA